MKQIASTPQCVWHVQAVMVKIRKLNEIEQKKIIQEKHKSNQAEGKYNMNW